MLIKKNTNKQGESKMDEPTLKEKIKLLEELKDLMEQLEKVEHRTCFTNYFSNDFKDKYYAMSNDIDFEINWLEDEEVKPIESKDIKVNVDRLQKLGIIKEGA